MKKRIFGFMMSFLMIGANLYGADGDLILNGKLGIGTTGPNAKLTVGTPLSGSAFGNTFSTNAGSLPSAAGSGMVLASIGFTSGNNTSLGFYASRLSTGSDWTTAAVGMGMDVDNSLRVNGASLWFHNNGNVGIGTSAPSQKLDVAGYVKGQSGLCIGSDCRTAWPSGGGGLTGSGSTNYVSKWTGGTSLGSSIIYDNGTNVGIGTTGPGTKLDVVSTNYPTVRFFGSYPVSSNYYTSVFFGYNAAVNQAATVGFVYNSTAPANSFTHITPWGMGEGGAFVISTNGNVGIATTPAYRLHLGSDSAAKPSTSTWTVASDARLKTNIKPYTKGLNDILQINPVTYQYNGKGGIGHHKLKKKDPQTGEETETEIVDTDLLAKTNVGVLAQEIQPIVPEAVTSHKGKINDDDTAETDILDFNSHSLTFILINAVKELSVEVDSLKKQIADLKGKVK